MVGAGVVVVATAARPLMSSKPAPHVQSCASPDGANGGWHAHAPMDCDAGGDDAPAKHGSHAVALAWSEYVPPGHAEAVASPPAS